ncbi:MAG: FxLYD domain-containing protein [Methyloceanibacter sp.]|uniref:FxLYD domain-containing protein n=1 Tax=Methyloceanibacter sp. TaxID=1965321 RepID=UPI003D9B5F2D
MQADADFDGGGTDYDFSAPYSNDVAQPQGTSFGTPADTTAELSPGYADTLGTNTPVPSSVDFGAAAANVAIGQHRARALPVVAIGWVVIVLTLVLVGALFAVAPRAVVSMLPGATRLYSAIGMDVNAYGLAFENVRYEWNNASGENVLEVQGQVANVSSGAMKVPALEISLRDEKGAEISAWTTELDAPQLAAGEQAPFAAQIPSPPANVRSLRVRFDTAAAN